jgi:2-oxoisovalerate dehydrogenase E2 component (dihydrolipoyl transacylase)
VANQFSLPDVGEGLTEAEITAWHVAVGETVALNQVLLEVETAKAVGSAVIRIGDTSEAAPASYAAIGTAAAAATPVDKPSIPASAEEVVDGDVDRQPVLVGYGIRATNIARRPRRAGAAAKLARYSSGRPSASPPVRKFARTLAVDLTEITPTGSRGQVTRDDVLLAATKGPTASAPADVRIPIKGTRKHIAETMVRSAFTAPHVTEWVSVDISRTVKLAEQFRASPAGQGLRITALSLVARATTLTLARHREINSSWDDSTGEILQHRDINLGIAVASPRGLIVPNIRAAQTLDFAGLSRELADLIAEARANRTTIDAMRGGTFTITNIGVFGVDGATPILNLGEAAILAFGQIRKVPWHHKGRVRLRSVTTLSLSFDHRLVDGQLGSTVLAEIAELLEQPARALCR